MNSVSSCLWWKLINPGHPTASTIICRSFQHLLESAINVTVSVLLSISTERWERGNRVALKQTHKWDFLDTFPTKEHQKLIPIERHARMLKLISAVVKFKSWTRSGPHTPSGKSGGSTSDPNLPWPAKPRNISSWQIRMSSPARSKFSKWLQCKTTWKRKQEQIPI